MRRFLLRRPVVVSPARSLAPLALVARRVLVATVALFAVLAPSHAEATSFLPVTFDDLVAQADVIFVGDVADVHPFTMQTPEGTIVKTRVTFRVSDPLAGAPGLVQVFDFLGGEADGVGLKIAGMPAFAVGDRRVVFARRDQSINPIVGFTQGLMRVTRDGNGIDRVLTLDGLPIVRPESIGTAIAPSSGSPAIAIRLTDLRARIAQAVAAKAANQ